MDRVPLLGHIHDEATAKGYRSQDSHYSRNRKPSYASAGIYLSISDPTGISGNNATVSIRQVQAFRHSPIATRNPHQPYIL